MTKKTRPKNIAPERFSLLNTWFTKRYKGTKEDTLRKFNEWLKIWGQSEDYALSVMDEKGRTIWQELLDDKICVIVHEDLEGVMEHPLKKDDKVIVAGNAEGRIESVCFPAAYGLKNIEARIPKILQKDQEGCSLCKVGGSMPIENKEITVSVPEKQTVCDYCGKEVEGSHMYCDKCNKDICDDHIAEREEEPFETTLCTECAKDWTIEVDYDNVDDQGYFPQNIVKRSPTENKPYDDPKPLPGQDLSDPTTEEWEHEKSRIHSMDDSKLMTRMGRIRNPQKMFNFGVVLEDEGKDALAQKAYTLLEGMGWDNEGKWLASKSGGGTPKKVKTPKTSTPTPTSSAAQGIAERMIKIHEETVETYGLDDDADWTPEEQKKYIDDWLYRVTSGTFTVPIDNDVVKELLKYGIDNAAYRLYELFVRYSFIDNPDKKTLEFKDDLIKKDDGLFSGYFTTYDPYWMDVYSEGWWKETSANPLTHEEVKSIKSMAKAFRGTARGKYTGFTSEEIKIDRVKWRAYADAYDDIAKRYSELKKYRTPSANPRGEERNKTFYSKTDALHFIDDLIENGVDDRKIKYEYDDANDEWIVQWFGKDILSENPEFSSDTPNWLKKEYEFDPPIEPDFEMRVDDIDGKTVYAIQTHSEPNSVDVPFDVTPVFYTFDELIAYWFEHGNEILDMYEEIGDREEFQNWIIHYVDLFEAKRGYALLNFIDKQYIIQVHDKVGKIGDEVCPPKEPGIRNKYNLDDIMVFFRDSVVKKEPFTKIAASLSADIVQMQPFKDCNHRTAFAMLNRVLGDFGYECYSPEEQLEKMLEKVGHMQITKQEWENWIIKNMVHRAPLNLLEPNALRMSSPLVNKSSSNLRSNSSNSSIVMDEDKESGDIKVSEKAHEVLVALERALNKISNVLKAEWNKLGIQVTKRTEVGSENPQSKACDNIGEIWSDAIAKYVNYVETVVDAYENGGNYGTQLISSHSEKAMAIEEIMEIINEHYLGAPLYFPYIHGMLMGSLTGISENDISEIRKEIDDLKDMMCRREFTVVVLKDGKKHEWSVIVKNEAEAKQEILNESPDVEIIRVRRGI